MGDFVLSLGAAGSQALGQAAGFLQFYPDMRIHRFDYPEFSLLLSSSDDPQLWAPFASADKSLLVALAGRIALDQKQWDAAAQIAGQGGLACKFISHLYSASGIAAVETLSGNFVILLFDRPARKLFLVTDRWGLFPAFRYRASGGHLAFSSHPDALADAVGESRNWDLTSFAEFILAGKLSAPFTYYRTIRALPVASTTTLSFQPNAPVADQTRTYFHFKPQPLPAEKTDQLADEFAAAFRQAVTKRTLPLLGKSAVALSGGLDSRTVLCAAPDRHALLTFSFYDQENLEFRIAKSIAQAAGAEFVPLKRTFDYYGDHALLGIRISAGMGCIASNHFLGFRPRLRDLGIQNLLTGCYCDYLFKGLALNKRVSPWTTQESLSPFDFGYYADRFTSNTDLGMAVQERLEQSFPTQFRGFNNESAILKIEHQRVFPLSYEADNAERSIPQRTMGWYVPIADNGLMEVFLNMSCSMKLNRRLFGKVVKRVCENGISEIPDANTGVPISASPFREALHSHLRRAGDLWSKLNAKATSGSWPDWGSYVRRSRVIQSLWSNPSSGAKEVFELVLGKEGFKSEVGAYRGKLLGVFLQLFTLKLWFDQRPQ